MGWIRIHSEEIKDIILTCLIFLGVLLVDVLFLVLAVYVIVQVLQYLGVI